MICFEKRCVVAIVIGMFVEEHNETYRNILLGFEVRTFIG